MIGVLLAKGIADLSFGGALLWYVVKYIVSAACRRSGYVGNPPAQK